MNKCQSSCQFQSTHESCFGVARIYFIMLFVIRLEHSHSFIDSLDNHSTTVSGPAWCRRCRPPGNSSIMCLVVWWLSPQGQAGDPITPHRWRDLAHNDVSFLFQTSHCLATSSRVSAVRPSLTTRSRCRCCEVFATGSPSASRTACDK